MPRRRARIPRCPCGKPTFRSYTLAQRCARRLPIPARVYYCPRSGGYHLTSLDRVEYAHSRALTGAIQAEEARSDRPPP
jgi:hypothetical protein